MNLVRRLYRGAALASLALFPALALAQGNDGAIWTTENACGTETQDQNQYQVGDLIVINGAGFSPGVYPWTVKGNPGGSSQDPGQTVASGVLTVTATDVFSVTGNEGPTGVGSGSNPNRFCYGAYVVRPDDGGTYTVDVGTKNDNYRTDGLLDASKTATTTWTRTYDWDIAKSVTPASLALFNGQSADVQYTVTATRSVVPGSDAYGVTGTVSVTNTSTSAAAVTVTDCLQRLTAGSWSTVGTCQTLATSIAPGANTFPYVFSSVPLDPTGTYRNLVTIAASQPGGEVTATAPIVFPATPTTEINGAITVDDTVAGARAFSGSGTWVYPRTFTCGRDAGLHPNTATIRETGESASASVTVACHGLTVAKTAVPAFTRSYDWTIAKTGPTGLTLDEVQVYDASYTITLTPTATDGSYRVAGTITIQNGHPTAAAADVAVADLLAGATALVLDCGDGPGDATVTIAAGGTASCAYTAGLPDGSTRTNTATATLFGQAYQGQAPVAFTGVAPALVDECVAVSDQFADEATAEALGQVCYNSRQFTVADTRTLATAACGPFEIVNTARFLAVDDANDTGEAGTATFTTAWQVVGCEQFGCTLTQGYWKTHNESFPGGAPPDPDWFAIGDRDGDGTSEGEDEAFFLSGKTWFEVMWTPPQGNAYYNLAHQWIAATLNSRSGAAGTPLPPAVQAALASGATFFATYTPASTPRNLRNALTGWAGTLGAFNEGTFDGFPHCDEAAAPAPATSTATTGTATPAGTTGATAGPVEAAAVPTEFRLHGAAPNPVRGHARFQVDLVEAAPTSLVVYDVMGRAVDVLFRGELEAGAHAMAWSTHGHAAGTYVVVLQSGTQRAVQRVLVVR